MGELVDAESQQWKPREGSDSEEEEKQVEDEPDPAMEPYSSFNDTPMVYTSEGTFDSQTVYQALGKRYPFVF
jgi:hypothetical protein